MNDRQRTEPAADRLARYKRASLRSQALRTVWQLEALVRRCEREAPEVHRRLRNAVEALQLLSAQLALEDEAQGPPAPAAAGPVGKGDQNMLLRRGLSREAERF